MILRKHLMQHRFCVWCYKKICILWHWREQYCIVYFNQRNR